MRNLHRSSTVYKPKQFLTNMWVDFDVRDNGRWTFSLEEVLLWIMYWYFRWKQRFEVNTMIILKTSQKKVIKYVNFLVIETE